MMLAPIRGRDAEAQLARALLVAGRRAGLDMELANARSRPWASATFVGTQHVLALAGPRAPALGRWVADLPLAELPLRDHFVASLAVDRIEDDGATVRIGLTVLTVEQA